MTDDLEVVWNGSMRTPLLSGEGREQHPARRQLYDSSGSVFIESDAEPKRSPNGTRKRTYMKYDALRAQGVALYEQGLSLGDVAMKMNVSYFTVRNWVVTARVARRRKPTAAQRPNVAQRPGDLARRTVGEPLGNLDVE